MAKQYELDINIHNDGLDYWVWSKGHHDLEVFKQSAREVFGGEYEHETQRELINFDRCEPRHKHARCVKDWIDEFGYGEGATVLAHSSAGRGAFPITEMCFQSYKGDFMQFQQWNSGLFGLYDNGNTLIAYQRLEKEYSMHDPRGSFKSFIRRQLAGLGYSVEDESLFDAVPVVKKGLLIQEPHGDFTGRVWESFNSEQCYTIIIRRNPQIGWFDGEGCGRVWAWVYGHVDLVTFKQDAINIIKGEYDDMWDDFTEEQARLAVPFHTWMHEEPAGLGESKFVFGDEREDAEAFTYIEFAYE